jgi:hypothetical protein
MRVRYGLISLPRGQRPGRWEELPEQAVDVLRRSVDLPPKAAVKGQRGDSRARPTTSGRRITGKGAPPKSSDRYSAKPSVRSSAKPSAKPSNKKPASSSRRPAKKRP